MADSSSYIKPILTIVITIALLVAIWLLGISGSAAAYARYSSDRSDPGSLWYTFPKWIQPNDSWHKWTGYPETFANVSSYIATSFSTTKANSSMTGVTDETDCMLRCAGEEDCVGFIRNTKSNTCTMYASVDGLFPSTSSNVFYTVKGKEPSKLYTADVGKTPTPPTSVTLSSGVTFGRSDITVDKIENVAAVAASGTVGTDGYIAAVPASVKITTVEPHGLDTETSLILYNYTGAITIGSTASAPGATSVIPKGSATNGRVLPTETTIQFPGSISAQWTRTAGVLPALLSTADSITKSGTSISFTTSSDHSFEVGQNISVTGAVPTSPFTNVFVITDVPDTRIFYVDLGTPITAGTKTTAPGSCALTSAFKPFSSKTAFNCATACTSNASCVSFIFDTTGTLCSQLSSEVASGTPIAAPTKTIYTVNTPTFTDSAQYW